MAMREGWRSSERRRKRYRGGRATPIWLADLSTSRIEKLPRTNANDFAPMWVDSRIFFLSDRNGPVTLFSYDTRSNGRVAHVYMPDTAFGGRTNVTRYSYAQAGKEAVIIDERFNGGGMLATDVIEHLTSRWSTIPSSSARAATRSSDARFRR